MPDIELGDNVKLEENSNGEPVLRHTPSGAEIKYDSSEDEWTAGSFNLGSVSTEVSDNAVNVNNFPGSDLGEKINNAVAAHGREDVVYNVKPGIYTLTTPADFTDHRGFEVDLSGTYITLATGGQPALDFTDSWDWTLRFSRLVGDADNPPSSGILSGTTGDDPMTGTEGAQAGGPERKWVWGGAMWGHYEYAPLFHADRERARFSADFANDHSQGYAAILTEHNEVDIGGTTESESSPYKGTITEISNAKTWFNRASFLSIQNTGDGVVWIEGRTSSTVFRDTEIVGKDPEALVTIDARNTDVGPLTFDGLRMRTDALDGSAVSSKPFLLQDGGAGNQLTQLHISDPNIEAASNGGANQPLLDVTGETKIRNLTIDGEPLIAATVNPITSPNVIQRTDLKKVPVGNVALGVYHRWSDLDISSPVALQDAASIVGEQRRQTTISGGGSNHAIRAVQNGANIEVRNVEVSASGSSYDAINTAGSGLGSKSIIENVRVTGSDRDGIVIDNMNATVVADCTTEGFGSGISGSDLVVRNSQLVIVSGCYFNGDVTVESTCSDVIINSYIRESLTDNGTRTVINGRGKNSGDPNSTGDWNGNEGIARKAGVVVEDTSNSNLYYAKADGTWSQIGS